MASTAARFCARCSLTVKLDPERAKRRSQLGSLFSAVNLPSFRAMSMSYRVSSIKFGIIARPTTQRRQSYRYSNGCMKQVVVVVVVVVCCRALKRSRSFVNQRVKKIKSRKFENNGRCIREGGQTQHEDGATNYEEWYLPGTKSSCVKLPLSIMYLCHVVVLLCRCWLLAFVCSNHDDLHSTYVFAQRAMSVSSQ